MRKESLKITCILMTVVLIALLAIGCGSKSPDSSTVKENQPSNETNPNKEEDKAGSKVELIAQQPDLNEGTYAQFKAFEEKTGIEVIVEQLPTDQFMSLVQTRAATNDLSDLLGYHVGSNLGGINPEENLIDVTGASYLENIDENFINAVTINEKIYGVPVLPVYGGGVLYNKKVYDELELEVPKTWDELIGNCQKVKENGLIPVAGTMQVTSTAQMVWLSDFYNVVAEISDFPEQYTANKIRLAETPIYLRSFEKMVEVYEKDFYNEDYLSTGRDEGLAMLAEGEAVHYFGLTREINVIAQNTPELVEDIDFFAQPSDDPDVNGLTIWMPHGYYIPKTAENVEGAKQFQEFMTTSDAVNAYVSEMMPTGPFLLKNITLPDNLYPAIASAIEYVNSEKTYPAQEFVTPIKGPNTPQICVEVSSGMKTAVEGAEAIDEDNKKFAKQLGLEGWE